MITERVADFLVEYPPFAVEITLYGATRETYEALTQIPGSYERCMRGIRLLKERNLPLKLKTVPTTVNRHEVYEMQRMAEEDFGVDFKFDPLVNPRIDCSQSPVEVRLTAEDAVALDLHEPRRRSEYLKLMDRDMALPADAYKSDNVYVCGGGLNSCAIDPYGQISICVLSHQESYRLAFGQLPRGLGRFPRPRPQQEEDAREQVRRVPDQDALRNVCREWGTGKGRRRIARRIPVRSRSLARDGAGYCSAGARRMRMLRGRSRAREFSALG